MGLVGQLRLSMLHSEWFGEHLEDMSGRIAMSILNLEGDPGWYMEAAPCSREKHIFTEGSKVCIVLWCDAVLGFPGQLSGPSGREMAGTWVCLSRDHQELDQVGEGGWIFTTPASGSSAYNSEYCNRKVQASSHPDAFQENTSFFVSENVETSLLKQTKAAWSKNKPWKEAHWPGIEEEAGNWTNKDNFRIIDSF